MPLRSFLDAKWTTLFGGARGGAAQLFPYPKGDLFMIRLQKEFTLPEKIVDIFLQMLYN